MFEFTRSTTPRRGFLGRMAAAMALGVTGLTPLRLEAQPEEPRATGADPAFEAWLNRITGKDSPYAQTIHSVVHELYNGVE